MTERRVLNDPKGLLGADFVQIPVFSVCKIESILVNADHVCLSASLTHPGVTIANFSTSDPWRLGPRQHRVPIALDADARPEPNPTSRGAVC